ncbi:MAG TPA: GH3 auxin-responsive promoter family protein [Polyangia bacterium]|nr:GH3 auxin-responsive promoter family protein [Polyangia bacterium]
MSSSLKRGAAAQARRLSHRAAVLACTGAARAFDRALADVQGAQVKRLRAVLRAVAGSAQAQRLGLDATMTPETFRARVGEHSYPDLADAIEQQRRGASAQLTGAHCHRYQPTSGSSSSMKWIPYTAGFLAELDAAISPWGFDLYRQVPPIARGRHYWSLSWMPTNLRAATAANLNDDRGLLSWSKRLFSAMTAPVPPWVATTSSSDDSLFATLCFLAAAADLTLISVWSPTFALNLLERLGSQRDAIVAVLDEGRWDDEHRHLPGRPPHSLRAAQLLRGWDGRLDPTFFAELWPMLSLVSAWDTSTSARWAARLAQLLPHAGFQGKGLWATEGAVTIPYRDQYPLALRSHYYEFVDLGDDKPYFSWQLRAGQIVRPLLTTSGGLLRYGLKDRLAVRGFLGSTPCFEFLDRIDDVDMVGEKMSPEAARTALDAIAGDDTCRPLTLLAVTPSRLDGDDTGDGAGDKPGYVALCEGPTAAVDQRRGDLLDDSLRAAFHYNLARDLGQLAPARVLTVADARRLYQEIGEARGMVVGNIKPEALLLCDDARSAALIRRRIGDRTQP